MSGGAVTPLLSTLGVLVVALMMLRAGRWPLARFRSALSRRASHGTGAVLLFVTLSFLPYGLNLCRGGFDDPLDCVLMPPALAEAWAAAAVLGIWVLLVLVPLGFALVLGSEIAARIAADRGR